MINKTLVHFIYLLIGVGVGVSGTYLNNHAHNDQEVDNHEMLEAVLKYSNTPILDEHYACEGRSVKTVGAVVASLLELNKMSQIDKLTYGCFNDTCTMSVSSCKPWQETECSSRFLKYNIDKNNNIKPKTFSCFDMP